MLGRKKYHKIYGGGGVEFKNGYRVCCTLCVDPGTPLWVKRGVGVSDSDNNVNT